MTQDQPTDTPKPAPHEELSDLISLMTSTFQDYAEAALLKGLSEDELEYKTHSAMAAAGAQAQTLLQQLHGPIFPTDKTLTFDYAKRLGQEINRVNEYDIISNFRFSSLAIATVRFADNPSLRPDAVMNLNVKLRDIETWWQDIRKQYATAAQRTKDALYLASMREAEMPTPEQVVEMMEDDEIPF
jgi:hypothetical protein